MEKRRIHKYEFNEILKYVPDISPEERAYLNQAFAGELLDGLTEWELKDKISKLKYNQEDNMDQWELEKIKKKLLEAMNK